MSEPSDAQVIKEVEARIEEAIHRTRWQKTLIILLSAILLLVGLCLIVYGAIRRNWLAIAPGALLQAMIYFPLNRLVKIKAEEMRLLVLPRMLRLASKSRAKQLAYKLIEELVGQVEP